MKLLVFSDIHGNAYALEALKKRLPELSYDRVVFLGDIFGYYYNQKQCIELLQCIPDLIWLKGNHDEYAVKSFLGEINSELLISSYGHSYGNLKGRFNKVDMQFIAELESARVMEIDGRKIGFFHGRPDDNLEGRIYGDTIIDEEEFCAFDIVFFGHTHCKIDRIIGKTRLLSPGSLGQPRDGNGYGFLIFDTRTDRCEYINVEVDNSALKRDIDKNDPELWKLYDVLAREK